MKVTTQGLGINIGERLEEKIADKFAKFGRYFGEDAQILVKVRPEKDQKKVEITLKVQNHVHRAESKSEDVLAAVDRTVEKLESQIRKQKTKIEKRIHDYAYMKDYLKDVAVKSAEEPEEEFGIIKRKSFDLDPMSADEAVLQMEMLGHNFHLFLNAEDGIVSLVYKRMDGNYGLIVPNY